MFDELIKNREVDLSKLNVQQQQAVIAPLKPVLVIAGAGTGKTTVLVKRFEYLVKEKEIRPDNILLISFSRRNVSNIRERLRKLLKGSVASYFFKLPYITTFHSFCLKLLEKELGKKSCKPCHDVLAKKVLQEIIEKHGLKLRNFSEIIRIIASLKMSRTDMQNLNSQDILRCARRNLRWREAKDEAILSYFEDLPLLIKKYDASLKKKGLIDFSDMLLRVETLLMENEEIRSKYDDRSWSILFDEFQDVDETQFAILKLLTRDKNNIFCVGDPDQSIYGFRGAIHDIFEKFEAHYSDVDIFKLEENYRSTPQILAVSNQLISKNHSSQREVFKKRLVTSKKDGDKVVYIMTDDQAWEYDFICKKIVEFADEGVELSKIAILSRNRGFVEGLKNEIRSRGLFYFDPGEFKLENRAVVRDLRAWFGIAFCPFSSKSKLIRLLKRVMKKYSRGIGEKTIQDLEFCCRYGDQDFLSAIDNSTNEHVKNFKDKILQIREEAIKEHLDIFYKVNKILEISEFWDYVKRNPTDYEFAQSCLRSALYEASDIQSVEANLSNLSGFPEGSVFCGTIHSAKGLEFDYVFVVGVSQGRLPSRFALEDSNFNLEGERVREERRMAYVAFTRPRKKLFISSSPSLEESIFMQDIKEQDGLLDVKAHFVNSGKKASEEVEDTLDFVDLGEDVLEDGDEDE